MLNNPLRFTDSTGHCAEEDKACIGRLREIQATYGITIDDGEGLFTLDALNAIAAGMSAMLERMGKESFAEVAGGTTYRVYHGSDGAGYRGVAHDGNGTLLVGDQVLNSAEYVTRYTLHELAHVWNWKCDDCMSKMMSGATGSEDVTKRSFLFFTRTKYEPNGRPPTDYARQNRREDWAESVTAVVDPTYVQGWGDAVRQSYVAWALQVGLPTDYQSWRWVR